MLRAANGQVNGGTVKQPTATVLYGTKDGVWLAKQPPDWEYIALPRSDYEGLQRGFACLKETLEVYTKALDNSEQHDNVALQETNRAIMAEVARLKDVVHNTRQMLLDANVR